MKTRIAAIVLALGGALGLGGCAITETGNPELHPTPVVDRARLEPAPVAEIDGAWRFGARAGAVEPAEGGVVFTDLDDATVAQTVLPVQEDGSVEGMVRGALTHQYLLQVRGRFHRSESWAFAVEPGSGLTAAPRPLTDCLEVDASGRFVGAATEVTVSVTSRCAAPVSLGAATLLYGPHGGVEQYRVVDGGEPVTLGRGDQHELLIERDGATTEDEVLLVTVTAPEAGRVPVALYHEPAIE